jgi:hypothetical protein
MRPARIAPVALAFLLAAAPAFAQKAPKAGPGLKLPPSENKGKPGSYQMHTKRAGNDYWVYVPKSYSDDNPAGLHLFFHGQGGNTGAQYFGQWAKYFLDTQNLIGINMQYQDGDNMKDPEGKVASAWEAVAQTIADYKILEGRGVVASFSGGGIPLGIVQQEHGNGGPPNCGPMWPFCHAAPYSSNFRTSINKSTPMSWLVSVGKEEWTLAARGETQSGRMADCLREAAHGGCPDVNCWISKKGHTIEDAEVAASAQGFRRSDLAFAPFLYLPDWKEKELAAVARDANGAGLGRSVKALERLLANDKLEEGLKARATKLKERLDARVKALVELVKELAANDPILCEYYSKIIVPRLGELPEAKAARDAMTEGRKAKGYAQILAMQPAFEKAFRQFFRNGNLVAEQAPFLENVKKVAPEKSLLGSMAAQYLLLQ